MRIVLGSLYEELLAVSLVVLTAECLGSERSRNALRVSHLQCTVNLIGRDHEVSQITCVCQLVEVDM